MPPINLVWSNVDLPPAEMDRLREFLSAHGVGLVTEPGELSSATVAFGQPPVDGVLATANLKWVQVSSAGITRYDTDWFRGKMTGRGTVFTNSSTVFDEPCAQHAAAMVLSMARQLPMALDDQRGPRKWLGMPMREKAHRLSGQSVLIYGYGAIGRKLAGYLTAFGMNVTGVRRNPRGDEGIPMLTNDQADTRLGSTDHVIDLLPSSPSTDGFFDARRIGLMSPRTLLYNIGRGATVDQPALVAALTRFEIAGAYLDVTTPEPLPADHPLWSLPNCWITPHSAGGHADEPERLRLHFTGNYERFVAGKPLVDRVI